MNAVTATVLEEQVTTDAYGDTTTVEVSTDVAGCLFAPRSSTERADSRTPAVITGASLYAPAGTVISPTSKIIVNGETYTVEGQPGDWGVGIEVALQRWEQP